MDIADGASANGKMKEAAVKASRTATWAKTMTKVAISQCNTKGPFWHVVNFLGANKTESRGIVDMLAVRKDHSTPDAPLNMGDLFEIVLIQVKGGSAKLPTPNDRERLRVVARTYNTKAIILSEWKKGSSPVFYRLDGDEWLKVDAAEIFGPHGKSPSKIRNNKKKAVKKLPVSILPTSSASKSSRANAAKKAWATRKSASSA